MLSSGSVLIQEGMERPSLLGNIEHLLKEVSNDVWSQAGQIKPILELCQGAEQTLLANGIVDDRQYMLENVIKLAASLPNDSSLRENLNGQFIKTLWNNLQHPPVSYLGCEYRSANGSGNNLSNPSLGAAGSHYARTVPSRHIQSASLPDPAVVFDTLFARQGPAKEHPNQISSMLFYFATIITHDIFSTDERDPTRVKSSSYLDLGPLYGHNQQEQDKVRTFSDGLLKKDTFSEGRLLGQPPGVCALLVAFNRFHNYIVTELAKINEGGRFSIPPGVTPESPAYRGALLKRDNDLFQTGRLVTCGLYMNIILGDYLRTILNLNQNPVNSDWQLDPRKDFSGTAGNSQELPRGGGNQVSAEFNMIYRWHSAISQHDEQWAHGFMAKVFGADVDPSELSIHDFLTGFRAWVMSQPRDPSLWTFGNLTRQEDGSFNSADLVEVLRAGTDNVAGAFGPLNVPKFMKAVECLGIQQGRRWRLATLNEVRLFFKLKPYSTFDEVNSDPEIAQRLETLYGHPDNIELYAGLGAEEAKETHAPGSGLCPGYTISTAILSDAVALVRGDRHYTVDYTPANLTAFGFKAVEADFDVAEGGVMHKLLMKAFPMWYRASSVYTLYPFTTPEKSFETMKAKGMPYGLEFAAPCFPAPPIPVTAWQGVLDVVYDEKMVEVPRCTRPSKTNDRNSILGSHNDADDRQWELVEGCVFDDKDTLEEVREFYQVTTDRIIRKHSRKLGQRCQLDIVKDLGNLVHVEFVSRLFRIPPSNEGDASSSGDDYTPREMARVLADTYAHGGLDDGILRSATSLKHQRRVAAECKRLKRVMASAMSSIQGEQQKQHHSGGVSGLRGLLFGGSSAVSERDDDDDLLCRLGSALVQRLPLSVTSGGGDASQEDDDDDAADIPALVGLAAGTMATQAHAVIDLLLSDQYYWQHWPRIQALALSDAPHDFEQLQRYVLEGFRLSAPTPGLVRHVSTDTLVEDGEHLLPARHGDAVLLDLQAAGKDPVRFPDPDQIRLDRPDDAYLYYGWGGPHACLGQSLMTVAAASMLRCVARLENLKRAPGPAGEMKSKLVHGTTRVFLSEDATEWHPYPQSKKVMFDGLRDTT